MNKPAEPALNLNFLSNYVLEDEIYQRLDKLQALCATQIMLDNIESAPPRNIVRPYVMVMEEQVYELRKLINELFG